MDDWEPLKLAKESKTFCVMPWIHQFTNQVSKVKLCCLDSDKPIGDLSKNTLKELWNSENIKQIRLDMLSGKKIVNCKWCDDRDSTTYSFKHYQNNLFLDNTEIQNVINSTEKDGSLQNHKLFYLDIRLNNLCNLSCRTCSEISSSVWAIENGREDFLFYPGKHNGDYYNQIIEHIDNVKSIYFAGGEPLIQKEHYELLEELISRNRTECPLRYNTNLTKLVYNKKNVLDYWSKFKKIWVMVSVDGNHSNLEYWRNGTNYGILLKNLDRKSTRLNSSHMSESRMPSSA